MPRQRRQARWQRGHSRRVPARLSDGCGLERLTCSAWLAPPRADWRKQRRSATIRAFRRKRHARNGGSQWFEIVPTEVQSLVAPPARKARRHTRSPFRWTLEKRLRKELTCKSNERHEFCNRCANFLLPDSPTPGRLVPRVNHRENPDTDGFLNLKGALFDEVNGRIGNIPTVDIAGASAARFGSIGPPDHMGGRRFPGLAIRVMEVDESCRAARLNISLFGTLARARDHVSSAGFRRGLELSDGTMDVHDESCPRFTVRRR